jgi:hypothetical protein
MSVFKTLSVKVAQLDVNDLIQTIISKDEVNDAIISLNQSQLKDFGQDNKGDVLRTYNARGSNVYSDRTIGIKQEKGQTTDKVTLYDTGDFYDTFGLNAGKSKVQFKANFKKPDGNISDNVDISDVLGLQEKNQSLMNQSIILPNLIPLIKRGLQL